MSRSEGVALAMDGPRQRVHLSGVYQDRRRKASREKNHDFVQHGFRNPFGKRKKSSLRNKHRKKTQQKEKYANNESANSVQKNTNSATSHRTGARGRRVDSRAGPCNTPGECDDGDPWGGDL